MKNRHLDPIKLVLVRKDFSDRKDLIELIHTIKHLYSIEKDAREPYIAVDQEGGNVVRLAFLNYNPSNAFLGNLDNLRFTEYVGSRTGYDLKDSGIDWDLAPVLDLSSPYNQVILERSFSYDPLVVAEHGKAFIRGIQRSLCAPELWWMEVVSQQDEAIPPFHGQLNLSV